VYDEILVPTDGSDASVEALDEAFRLAKKFGSTVHAVYVIDDTALASLGLDDMTFDTYVDDYFDDLEAFGEKATGRIRTAAEEEGLTVVTSVLEGVPDHEIVDYADDHGIDLIVMATRGRRGLPRALLGSTTERVVRCANVPVLTIRMGSGSRGETTEE